jgi:hypothetical protein
MRFAFLFDYKTSLTPPLFIEVPLDVGGIDSASFYVFDNELWNCSDRVVYIFCFLHFTTGPTSKGTSMKSGGVRLVL